MKPVRIDRDNNEPWFVYLRFQYHLQAKDYVKSFPGAKWDGLKKAWRVPIECVNLIKDGMERFGYKMEEAKKCTR